MPGPNKSQITPCSIRELFELMTYPRFVMSPELRTIGGHPSNTPTPQIEALITKIRQAFIGVTQRSQDSNVYELASRDFLPLFRAIYFARTYPWMHVSRFAADSLARVPSQILWAIHLLAIASLNNQPETMATSILIYPFILNCCRKHGGPIEELTLLSIDKRIAFHEFVLSILTTTEDDEDVSDPINLRLIAPLFKLKNIPFNFVPGELDVFTKTCQRFKGETIENCLPAAIVVQFKEGVIEYMQRVRSLPAEKVNLKLCIEMARMFFVGDELNCFEGGKVHHLGCLLPNYSLLLKKQILALPKNNSEYWTVLQQCNILISRTDCDPNCLRLYRNDFNNSPGIFHELNLMRSLALAMTDLYDKEHSYFSPYDHLAVLFFHYEDLVQGLNQEELDRFREIILQLGERAQGVFPNLIDPNRILSMHKEHRALYFLELIFIKNDPHGQKHVFMELFYHLLSSKSVQILIREDSPLYDPLRDYYYDKVRPRWKDIDGDEYTGLVRTVFHKEVDKDFINYFLLW